jgi:mRNA-degrading endonuclease YafQ of YafQ-DinJ toxin-antitoxin module
MPELIPSRKFSSDLEKLQTNKALIKKIAQCLTFLEENPFHPGLHIVRISNDSSAWSARVDSMYRISFEPSSCRTSGTPDWSSPLNLLRILTHDDLYKSPH